MYNIKSEPTFSVKRIFESINLLNTSSKNTKNLKNPIILFLIKYTHFLKHQTLFMFEEVCHSIKHESSQSHLMQGKARMS